MQKYDFITCPKCLKVKNIDDKFCSLCGFNLENFVSDPEEVFLSALSVIESNPGVAFEYLRYASHLGCIDAMFELGKFYESNDCLSLRNLTTHKRSIFAEKCYYQAASKGHKDSLKKLMSLYNTDLLHDEIAYNFIKNIKAKEQLQKEKAKLLSNLGELFEKVLIDKIDKIIENLYENSINANLYNEFLDLKKSIKKYSNISNMLQNKDKIEIIEDKIIEYLLKVEKNKENDKAEKRLISVIEDVIDKLSSMEVDQTYLLDLDKLNENLDNLTNAKLKIKNFDKLNNVNEKVVIYKAKLEPNNKNIVENRLKKLNNNLEIYKNKYLNKRVKLKHSLDNRIGIVKEVQNDENGNFYIIINFENDENNRTWKIPDAFENGYLTLQDGNENKTALTEYKAKEIKKEKEYLEKVIKACEPLISNEYKSDQIIEYNVLNVDDDFDRQELADHGHTLFMQSFWRRVSMKPFFASVKSDKYGTFYIGQSAVTDLVLDWRDKKCNIYYQHNSFTYDRDVSLAYVRNHDISYKRYLGFIDVFNSEEADEEDDTKTIQDKYFKKILLGQREKKKTHEIIETIQKQQYEIISNMQSKYMLVNGCAGSGKTMVLFHRVAYLAFNNKDFNPKDYLIVSANNLLCREAMDLSRQLNLGLINNFDCYRVYFEFVNEYIKNSNSSIRIYKNFEKNVNNMMFYSDDFLSKLFIKVLNVDTEEFKDYFFSIIKKAYENILDIEVQNDDELAKTTDKYKTIFHLLSKVPEKNIRFIALDDSQTDNKDRNEANFLITYLNKYFGSFGLYTIKKTLIKSLDKRDLRFYEDVKKYIKEIQKRNVGASYFDSNIIGNPELVFLYDLVLLLEMSNNYIKFLEGDYEIVFLEKINYVLEKQMYLHSIKTADKVFVYAYLLKLHGIKSGKQYKSIFIDEYQNYSKAEINFFKTLSDDGSFNLFGDYKQRIDAKGCDLATLREINTFDEYNLNANYRNAKQICEFVNKEFNMKMLPIGIDGEVVTVKKEDVDFRLPNNSDRVALIVSDLSKAPLIDKKFNIIKSDFDSIKINKINVMTIESVKGLEFEIAYVLDEDLTENQRYLAFTRALNKLILLK